MGRLTKSLIVILGVCDNDEDDGKADLHQFLLKSENPFFDIFTVTIGLFKSTVCGYCHTTVTTTFNSVSYQWREMKAGMDDIEKVFSVVRSDVLYSFARSHLRLFICLLPALVGATTTRAGYWGASLFD